ncbi:MAG: hypothetical protein ACPG31_11230 [Planctomycetota bacterium]
MRMHLLSTALLSVAALTATSSLSAQTQLLDVEQANVSQPVASFNQADLAQSFQPTVDKCSGASAFMMPGWGVGGTLTIELWDALPNVGGANMLASGSSAATPGEWVDVIWGNVSVTSGATYYLVFSGTDPSMALAGENDSYPGGHVFANAGYIPFPTIDYAFRTWYENTLDLSISGTCPGPMTITVSGATPNGSVAVVYGNAGSFTLPSAPCAGIVLDLDFPNLAGLFTADANGDLVLTPTIPAVVCGWTLQVVDATNCAVSTSVIL